MGGRSNGGFKLRLPEGEIAAWAARFPGDANSEAILAEMRPVVLARGHLTRGEFLRLCEWKSARSRPRCRRNGARKIETLTRAAFATPDEAVKMDLLLLLDGVSWPTASTILHFCDPRPYPVLDVRATWTVGFAKPPRYTMAFWLGYVAFTRGLAARVGLSMRVVDKALWQYSYERQR